MTLFFKKLRKKLLDQGHLRKYLLYAFGEIILVVAGILIALQINNRNEQRKSNLELNAIFKTIKQDLQNDIREVRMIGEIYNDRMQKIDTILDGHADLNYLRNCKNCAKLTLNFIAVIFNKRGYELLKSQGESSGILNDSLLMDIDEFYRPLFYVTDAIDTKIESLTFESLEDIRQKHPDWFVEFIKTDSLPKGLLEYIRTDKDHRTRLAFLRLLVEKNYLPLLERFEPSALELITKIDNRIN